MEEDPFDVDKMMYIRAVYDRNNPTNKQALEGEDKEKQAIADAKEMEGLRNAYGDENSGKNRSIGAPVFPSYMERKIKSMVPTKADLYQQQAKSMINYLMGKHSHQHVITKSYDFYWHYQVY